MKNRGLTAALQSSAAVVAMLGGMLAITAGTASAATAGAAGPHIMACGYYETATDAYYGHCGSTQVMIQVDIDWWPTDILRCVSRVIA